MTESQNLEKKEAVKPQEAEKPQEKPVLVERKPKKKAKKKNGNSIAKLVMEKLKSIGLTEEAIEDFNNAVNELESLNKQMAEIMAKRTELRATISDFLMQLSDKDKQLLDFLGLIDVEKARGVIGDTEKPKKKKTGGGKKGNGLTGKTIVYDGQEYKQARYFMQKYEITGGLEGLKEWAESNGLTVTIEEDTIYIQ